MTNCRGTSINCSPLRSSIPSPSETCFVPSESRTDDFDKTTVTQEAERASRWRIRRPNQLRDGFFKNAQNQFGHVPLFSGTRCRLYRASRILSLRDIFWLGGESKSAPSFAARRSVRYRQSPEQEAAHRFRGCLSGRNRYTSCKNAAARILPPVARSQDGRLVLYAYPKDFTESAGRPASHRRRRCGADRRYRTLARLATLNRCCKRIGRILSPEPTRAERRTHRVASSVSRALDDHLKTKPNSIRRRAGSRTFSVEVDSVSVLSATLAESDRSKRFTKRSFSR